MGRENKCLLAGAEREVRVVLGGKGCIDEMQSGPTCVNHSSSRCVPLPGASRRPSISVSSQVKSGDGSSRAPFGGSVVLALETDTFDHAFQWLRRPWPNKTPNSGRFPGIQATDWRGKSVGRRHSATGDDRILTSKQELVETFCRGDVWETSGGVLRKESTALGLMSNCSQINSTTTHAHALMGSRCFGRARLENFVPRATKNDK